VESRWRLNVGDLVGFYPGLRLFARYLDFPKDAVADFPNAQPGYPNWHADVTPFGDFWTFKGYSPNPRPPGGFPWGAKVEPDH